MTLLHHTMLESFPDGIIPPHRQRAINPESDSHASLEWKHIANIWSLAMAVVKSVDCTPAQKAWASNVLNSFTRGAETP